LARNAAWRQPQRDVQDANRLSRGYVELNPVRAGIVQEPGTYRWSSYLHHGLGTHDDLVAEHPLYLGLGTSPEARQHAWREICGHQIPKSELGKLREALKSGIIIGEPTYLEVD
jgi:REP-associated tyrosine transposase